MTRSLSEGLFAATDNGYGASAKRLLPHWIAAKEILDTLHDQVQRDAFYFVDLLVKSLIKTNQITSQELDALFRMAVEPNYRIRVVAQLIDQQVDRYCPDALRLVAQGTWGDEKWSRLGDLRDLHQRRTQATAIQALCVATTEEVVHFLLENEDLYYMERILLDHAPTCISPRVVRFLLKHGRAADPNQVMRFDGVAEDNGSDAALAVDELEKLAKLQDPEMDAFVVPIRSILLSSRLWKDSSLCTNRQAIQYLCLLELLQLRSEGSLPHDTMEKLMMTKDCVEVVNVLVQHGDANEDIKRVLVRQLMHYFLGLGYVPKATENQVVVTFSDLGKGQVGPLSVHDVEKLALLQNPEMTAFAAKHSDLVFPSLLWITAVGCQSVLVVEFLCREVSMPQWEAVALNVACGNNDLPLVELLFVNGRRGLARHTLEKMVVNPACAEVVEFLIDQKDEDVQKLIMDVVACGLASVAMSNDPPFQDVVMPLVGKLLLEIAAELGSWGTWTLSHVS